MRESETESKEKSEIMTVAFPQSKGLMWFVILLFTVTNSFDVKKMGGKPPPSESDFGMERMNENRGKCEKLCVIYAQNPSISNVESFAVIFTYRLMKIVLRMCLCVRERALARQTFNGKLKFLFRSYPSHRNKVALCYFSNTRKQIPHKHRRTPRNGLQQQPRRSMDRG